MILSEFREIPTVFVKKFAPQTKGFAWGALKLLKVQPEEIPVAEVLVEVTARFQLTLAANYPTFRSGSIGQKPLKQE